MPLTESSQLACAQRNGCDIIVTCDKKYKDYTDIMLFDSLELYTLLFSWD